jgi:hypothetical protein
MVYGMKPTETFFNKKTVGKLAYLEFVYSLYAWTDFISFNLFGDHDRISTLRRCLHTQ